MSMRFLVQKIHGKIVHDFVFELMQSKRYYDWSGQDKVILRCHELTDFSTIMNPDKYIPVGSIEFVSKYLERFYQESWKALVPLNVPMSLFPFAGRQIANIRGRQDLEKAPDVFFDSPTVFIKSMYKIKDPNNGPVPSSLLYDDLFGVQVSEIIDIMSEWRVFVFEGRILHIANYAGDSLAFPNPDTIREMIRNYADAPSVYTLDVAVKDSGETVIIECHRFFSCGLYGFSDYRRLPIMLTRAWKEMIR